MWKLRIIATLILIAGIAVGYFDYASEFNEGSVFSRFPFKLGLDLSGGTHLVYRADLSAVDPGSVRDSLDALRDVIERRVNIFGVSEPVVQTETPRGTSVTQGRLIVELPGVTDVEEAVALIGATPTLDFRVERSEEEIEEISEKAGGGNGSQILLSHDDLYVPTDLTGRFLQRATLQFDQLTGFPSILLTFDDEGKKIFADITKENIGKTVGIFLDGAVISTPVVREEITDGNAQITGDFTNEEARTLVGRLNAGALPIPITLISTQNIGASLGEEAVDKGIRAGVIGLIFVSTFFIFWYRLPGVVAIFALATYLVVLFSLFKLIPVTLTAAGVAGFILSIGLAVDANILIFERVREELSSGEKDMTEAIRDGFLRAWLSIRDANISSFITAVILFWFGTSLIKGFALTFGIGIAASMLSAVVVTRVFLLSFGFTKKSRAVRFLFGSGLK